MGEWGAGWVSWGPDMVRPAYRLSSFQNKSESSTALQAKLVTGWAGAWRLSASPGACITLLLLHQEAATGLQSGTARRVFPHRVVTADSLL